MPEGFRIVLVRQEWHADGGAERFLAATMAALAGRGIVTTLVTRSWPKSDAAVVRCDPPHLGRLWRDVSFRRAARREIAKLDADLVQSHERMAGVDVYRAGDGVHAEWLRQKGRTLGPLRRALVRASFWHAYILRAERRMFEDPRLEAVICNSDMVKHEIASRFAIDPAKLHVIPTAVDLERFHPRLRSHRAELRRQHGLPEAALVALFVGSGFERKGLATAIEALAQAGPEWRLVVAGSDRKPHAYSNLARRRGVFDRVTFLGAVPDVAPLLGAADVFMLPTLYDPLPNAALEALAAGLPQITSSKSGAAEMVSKGGAGFVADALDAGAMAARLRELADPELRARLGAAARTAALPFTPERALDELVRLYELLLAERPGRSTAD